MSGTKTIPLLPIVVLIAGMEASVLLSLDGTAPDQRAGRESQGTAPTIHPAPRLSTRSSNLPAPCDVTARSTFSRHMLPPGATLSGHKRPFTRYGYILSGRLTAWDASSGRFKTFGVGNTIMADGDQQHDARNTGDTPLDLVVVDLAPAPATEEGT